jgi:hypothetical protein
MIEEDGVGKDFSRFKTLRTLLEDLFSYTI